MSDDLVVKSRSDIVKGSKSFSLASFFFDQDRREAAWLLYAWCRYCDDQVDNSSPEDIQSVVQELKFKTLESLRGVEFNEHPWPSFQKICTKYKIPNQYPLDLIEGFERDAERKPIQDQTDLNKYCYGVASTVGLMMCYIMGVSSQKALAYAVSLGRAMQMTNIARDVSLDYSSKRIYLPLTWLEQRELHIDSLLESDNRRKLSLVVTQLLDEADKHYAQAKLGLEYLPLRSAWAVASALEIYKSIGVKIRKNVLLSFDRRTVVSTPEKIICIFRASLKVLLMMKSRIFNPWQKATSLEVWSKS